MLVYFTDVYSMNLPTPVQSEKYLRNPDESIARDPVTGEGRRVDDVVVEDGQVKRMVETSSPGADKTRQVDKEERIRKGTYVHIRDRNTGDLLPAKGVPIDPCRKP